MSVTNALAYYGTESITAVECFIVQGPDCSMTTEGEKGMISKLNR